MNAAARSAALRTYVEYELHPYGWRAQVRVAPIRSAEAVQAAKERARTAVHEAAHGVVARAIGLAVEMISIDEPGGEGVCRILWPSERRSPVQQMFFQLAGVAAQILTYGDYSGSDQDLERAEESARALIAGRKCDPAGLVARCEWACVEPLVTERMHDINMTALALLEAPGPLEGFEELAVLGTVPTREDRHVVEARKILEATAEGPKHPFWRSADRSRFLTAASAAGVQFGKALDEG